MNIWMCDRCNKSLKKLTDVIKIECYNGAYDIHKNHYDLCEECYGHIKTFINELKEKNKKTSSVH